MTGKHAAGGASHAEHPPHLQHHFDTPQQQFDSAKMGMWLFLATEVLLFAGLFCAYAVYRANHPEVFVYASRFLDTNLGALNTCVLLFSSLTVAWAVRAAQLGQKNLLVGLLAVTILCGFGFMSIKYVEYSEKWKHGLLWGERYDPAGHDEHAAPEDGEAHGDAEETAGAEADEARSLPPETEAIPKDLRSTIPPASIGPTGMAEIAIDDPGFDPHAEYVEASPHNVQLFFSVYFGMTGLHGLHVLAGMVLLTWLMIRAMRGRFGPQYFTPVDLGALYWHLVDLIWIFLFPLLYLIG